MPRRKHKRDPASAYNRQGQRLLRRLFRAIARQKHTFTMSDQVWNRLGP